MVLFSHSPARPCECSQVHRLVLMHLADRLSANPFVSFSHGAPDNPKPRSRKESRLTTIRHGGPCGLQIEMRSAEREGKSVVFDATNAVPGCHTLRGGGWHDFSPRSTTATFVHLPHSAVVIRFETALALRTREKGGGRERPPPKTGGSCGPAQMAFVARLCTGPHGVAHVLIYPCGKARTRA